MTDTEAMKWLQRYDKHLWGINASYVDAAKLMAPSGLRPKPKQIASLLFDTVATEAEDEHCEIKASTRLEWRGTIRYWKCPDYAGGPRRPTTDRGKGGKKWQGPSTRQWDALKMFMTENKAVLMEPTTTIAFAIRLMRSHWLPCNQHIVTELFTLRKIPLRRLP